MRAVRCVRYGTPAELELAEIDPPEPGPGQVVASVRAAAVNFPDVLMIADRYQVSMPLPFTPGSEFAGVVEQVGPGVEGLAVGDAVMGSSATGLGCFAEKVAAEAQWLRRIPDGLGWVEAAASGVTFRTAYHALVTIGAVEPGDWVVALGAAGGVGSATVEVAHRLGAQVVACAATAERLAACAELGAEAAIAYDEEDLKERIKEVTDGGADIVVDPVGGPYSEPALRATRWGGRFVAVGFAAGDIPRIPLNLVLLKGVIVRGFEIRTLRDHLPEAVARGDTALGELLAGGLRPMVSEVYALEDTPKALESVAERRAVGKVVIDVSAS